MVVFSSPVRQQDNPNTLKIPDNVGVVQETVLLYEKQRTFDARQVLRRKASSDPNPINLPTRGQRQQHPVDKATNLGRLLAFLAHPELGVRCLIDTIRYFRPAYRHAVAVLKNDKRESVTAVTLCRIGKSYSARECAPKYQVCGLRRT